MAVRSHSALTALKGTSSPVVKSELSKLKWTRQATTRANPTRQTEAGFHRPPHSYMSPFLQLNARLSKAANCSNPARPLGRRVPHSARQRRMSWIVRIQLWQGEQDLELHPDRTKDRAS